MHILTPTTENFFVKCFKNDHSFQVKLLESLESMDEDCFNVKFGGVLTYTTVRINFLPIIPH